MRSVLKVAGVLMLLSVQMFFSIGCDKNFATGARENTAAFFRTVNLTQRKQTADSENLCDKQISLLNGRAFIKMPAGATHMNRSQEKAFSIRSSYNTITDEYIAWGGSDEVLVLHIEDLFFLKSNDISQDFRSLQYYVEADESAKAVSLSEYAIACVMPYEQIRPTREGEQYIVQSMIVGAGNTLMKISFSLYSNEWDRMDERVDFYQELAFRILETATPGTRILGAQAETVRFEQVEVKIPARYATKHLEKTKINKDPEDNYSYISIEKIGQISKKSSRLNLKFSDSSIPLESETVPITKPDILLGENIVWEYKQWSIPGQAPFEVWETFVPLRGKKVLHVTLYLAHKEDQQELFDIIHTLKKK